MTLETVQLLTPEIVLIAAATFIYLAGAFLPKARDVWNWLAAVSIFGAGWMLFGQETAAATNGPLVIDALGSYVRWLTLALGLLFVLMAAQAASQTAEFVGSLLMILAGVMLVSVAGDLVLLFVGLELISIPTYVLLYLGRHDAQSQESTVKYFYLSVLSSAVLLYGFSFLYGITGTTSLVQMAEKVGTGAANPGSLGLLALVLIFAGLGFKVGVAPFHWYAPDVYQGTTHGNAALLSVVPKVAGLIALVRIVGLALPGMEAVGWRVAFLLAVLTMTVGNVLALWQDNLRRLLAYSSIAHAGYLLIGLAVAFASPLAGDPAQRAEGLGSLLLYLGVYAAATTGAFAALAWLEKGEHEVQRVDQLAGLNRKQPVAAAALAICLFSLAGIPPLAGFMGKLGLFKAALGVDVVGGLASPLRMWFIGLAVVGVLNAAIAAAYYLRVIAALYFREPLDTVEANGGKGAWTAMFASTVLVLLLGLFPGPLVRFAYRSAASPAPEPAMASVEVEQELAAGS